MNEHIFRFDNTPSPPPTQNTPIPEDLPQSLSSFYFRKKHLNFLQQYPDGTIVRLNREDVVSVLKAEGAFDSHRNLDQFFYKLRHSRAVDYDGPLPGYRIGLHRSNGQNLFCSSAAAPIKADPSRVSAREADPALKPEPPSGEDPASRGGPDEAGWPIIAELLRRLLVTPESGDLQRLTILAHLKVAHATLLRCLAEPDPTTQPTSGTPTSGPAGKRNVRPQQALALCGAVASGKTFLFEQVIAPILGNRIVDAHKAFCASSEGFTGELLNGEVWKIDDHAGSTRPETRRTFSSNIKAYLFSGNVSIHPKNLTPITLSPYGRLFIICNDEDKDMLILPDMSNDILDKIIVLRTLSAKSPMPSDTDEEREAYQIAVHAELPSLVAALEAWEIPESIRATRTGVASYHNPVIIGKLETHHPEVLLIEMIHQAIDDETLMQHPETLWHGTATDLHRALTNSASHAFARSASELLSNPKATGMYLGKITEASAHFEQRYQLCIRQGSYRRGIKTYLINATSTGESSPVTTSTGGNAFQTPLL